MNFSATQRLRLKHPLELECGLRVRFLCLLFMNLQLVFRPHRVPVCHYMYSPLKTDSDKRLEILFTELYSSIVFAKSSFFGIRQG